MIWPYQFCYYATFVSDRVGFIENVTYDLNWFQFPRKMQKYVILIILRSQKRIQFNGLNLIGCSLQVFGNVSDFPHQMFNVNEVLIYPIFQISLRYSDQLAHIIYYSEASLTTRFPSWKILHYCIQNKWWITIKITPFKLCLYARG